MLSSKVTDEGVGLRKSFLLSPPHPVRFAHHLPALLAFGHFPTPWGITPQGEGFSCCAYTGVPAFKTTYPHLCRYLCKTPGTSIWKAPEFLCFMRFSGWLVEKLLFHVAHNSDVNLVQLLGISDSPAQWAGLILFISTARAE